MEGGFVVSLSGRPRHSVALDEAHEMKINKECKTSIVRPSRDYISRVASYLPFRAKCNENPLTLKSYYFQKNVMQIGYRSIVTTNAQGIKVSANINSQVTLMVSNDVLLLVGSTMQ